MTLDPNISNGLLNIALNVVSNGLTSLIAKTGSKAEELIVGKEFLEKQELAKTSLQSLLQNAIKDLAKSETWNVTKGTEIISLFLLTPEVEEIVRQIYSTKIVENPSQNRLSSIRTIFLNLLIQFFTSYPSEFMPEPDQLTVVGAFLFDSIIENCNFLLENAIETGILAAHEAQEVFRHNMLASQIEAIQRELDLLATPYKTDRGAILQYEEQYRHLVGRRCSRIIPPNLNSSLPYPIDNLYVYPSFIKSPKVGQKLQETILKKDQFFSKINRAVLLGNPGGGKSTLSLKICHDLVQYYSQRIFAGRKELTPILVILQNYGVEKKERNCSILEFIEAEAKTRYQLLTPPPNTFQYLLLTGRSAVIFDGLDELLDTSYRQEIRDDVENFCHLYPSVPVLVTSREIGYEQAPLDEKLFQIFQLAPFDDEQTQEYVKKWFDAADKDDLTEEQRKLKADAFIKDSQSVPDLRSNPLMLALLCSIYREEHYIPRYRPDVYEKCALMLFERWDKNRSIYVPPIPEEEVRPLMEYIAQWIYEDEQLRAGVTEEELVEKTMKYLHDSLYENRNKSKRLAHDFIKFCTGRAWVFTDTGTKKQGENLYQFTHLTFLEFFTASYLVNTHITPASLLAILTPRIIKREWDVVAQLAFQLQSKKNISIRDELIETLIDKSYKVSDEEALNLLSFVVRSLQFIVPRPKVRRLVTEAFLEKYILLGVKNSEDGRRQHFEQIELTYSSIHKVSPENFTSVEATLYEFLTKQINSNDDMRAILAIEWILRFEPSKNSFKRLYNRILNECTRRMEILAPKSRILCYHLLWQKKIRLADCVKWFGSEALFNSANFILFSNIAFTSIIDSLIFELISGYSKQDDLINYVLQDLGNILLTIQTPWANLTFRRNLRFTKIGNFKTINNDVCFSLFILFAILLEESDVRIGTNTLPINRKYHLYKILFLALARYESDKLEKVQTILDDLRLKDEQQTFVWRWIRQEINLITFQHFNLD